jgi:hypothetical protein
LRFLDVDGILYQLPIIKIRKEIIMPRKTVKTAAKKRTPKVMLDAETMEKSTMLSADDTSNYAKPVSGGFKLNNAKIGIILIVLVLLGVLLVRKGYIVAATVNNQPIFSWSLTSALMNRYGKQTLEGMITEQLIYQEAAKNNVSVSADDLKIREEEMVKNIGADVKLDDLLKYQGMTRADFDSQVKLQLLVEKILGKDVNFTDAQLDNFISTSSAMLVATDSAQRKVEAKKVLTEQEINAKIQPWLLELKNNAKILRMF